LDAPLAPLGRGVGGEGGSVSSICRTLNYGLLQLVAGRARRCDVKWQRPSRKEPAMNARKALVATAAALAAIAMTPSYADSGRNNRDHGAHGRYERGYDRHDHRSERRDHRAPSQRSKQAPRVVVNRTVVVERPVVVQRPRVVERRVI